MFNRLVIPKGGTVTFTTTAKEGDAVVLSTASPDGKSRQGGPLDQADTRLFAAIFPPGTYYFPNGLEVPKLRSIKIDVRLGVVTVR